MTLDYSVKGQVLIDMTNYIQTMMDDFPEDCLQGKKTQMSWDTSLFKVQENQVPLNQDMKG